MSTYDRAYYRRQGELAADWEWRQNTSASDEEDPILIPSTTKTVHMRPATESRKARQHRELAEAADELATQLLEKHTYEIAEEKREKRRKAQEAKRAEAEQKERELAAANNRLAAYEAYYAEQERRRKAEEAAFQGCCSVS